ncbi:MAG: helical backbone metal receptor [Acidimicrobiia bacterium]
MVAASQPSDGPSRPVRVVSLVPSLTESILAWGVEPVACTRFCEQPRFEHVGGTKDPDVERIVALQPDVVLLCEEENRLEDYEALRAQGVPTHSVRIDDVADVASALAGVAAAVGVAFDPQAMALPAARPAGAGRVFAPVWRRPWIALGAHTYGASVLRHLGFTVLLGDGEVRYPEVAVADVAAAGPDLIVLPTEPYPFKERHLDEWADVAPAVLVDGQDLFWWGTRTPAALARLAAALPPVSHR